MPEVNPDLVEQAIALLRQYTTKPATHTEVMVLAADLQGIADDEFSDEPWPIVPGLAADLLMSRVGKSALESYMRCLMVGKN